MDRRVLPADHQVGTTVVDRYRLVRLLGSGPHGAVYEALDRSTGAAVALKFLRREVDLPDPSLPRPGSERRRENALVHPNLVDLAAIGRDLDGTLYAVMQLVRGVDVASLLRAGPLPELAALQITRQALHGLDAAHSAGVVHGNLKPENLMVAGAGHYTTDSDTPVCVLEVSFAKLFAASSDADVFWPASDETPYRAPELLTGGPLVDGVDLFAMGVMMFEMLTGLPPVSVADLVDDCSDQLAFVIWKALQPDPRDRYRTASEMTAGVDAALRASRPLDRDR